MPGASQVLPATGRHAGEPLLTEGCQDPVLQCGMISPHTLPRILSAVLLIAALAAAPARAAKEAPKPAAAANLTGLHDFDFLFGDWKVHHRTLRAGTTTWVEFEGTSSTRPIMGGAGNLEDNVLVRPGGTYPAAAVRAYDSATGQWAIWWVDGRAPHGPLDPPVKGGFTNGVGSFYSDDTLNGQPIRVRYLWSHITPTSARWEQAYSKDAGKTWDTNWTMDFTRVK